MPPSRPRRARGHFTNGALTLSIVFFAWWIGVATALLNLLLVPRLRPRQPSTSPLVSVLIPARDEERAIGRTVRAFLAQTYANLEVIVTNDRSTDATGEILAGIDDPRLVVVTGEDPPPGWLGKPWALHQASRRAKGELLLIVDADVVYGPEAIAAAVAHIEKGDAAMLALFPHFEQQGFWERVAMPQLLMTAFAFLPSWLANRTRNPYIGIGGGPGNLVRRADFDAVGGYPEMHDAVVDDVGLARRIRRAGRRTEFVRADDLISIRMYHGGREILDGFTKNTFPAFGGNIAAAVMVLVSFAVFHLLPYLLALAGNLWAIGSVLLVTLIRVMLFTSFRYRLDHALLSHPLMTLFWTVIFVRSIWVTGIRKRVRWRGRESTAWSRFGKD